MKRLILVALLATLPAHAEKAPWEIPLSKLTGLVVPKDWATFAGFKSEGDFKTKVQELPAKFDWRDCSKIPPVRLQVNNDCWAQGTAAQTEMLAAIHGVLGEERISVQQVIDCSGRGTAARGGYFAQGLHETKGAATEADYPYTGRDNRCRSSVPGKYFLSRWGYVGGSNRRPSVSEMKQAIYEHGPIGVTITANSAMQRFQGSGVFKGCSNGGTNHIVTIVGWDDAQQVWLMRNSWGSRHGDRGYAKIPYGCSRIGEQTTWADLKVEGAKQ